MNTLVKLMLVFMLMVAPVSAFAAEAVQMWKCGMEDEASEEEVQALAAEWLKAAKTMKGGEKLEAYVYFPVAVNVIGDVDFWFVVTAPTFEEWGKFWDNYADSPAEEVDKKSDKKVTCPDSALWELVKVK